MSIETVHTDFKRQPKTAASVLVGSVPADWQLATEVALEVGLNGAPFAVMMVTPMDLADFAVGFAYTENVLTNPDLVSGVDVSEYLDGIVVDIEVEPSGIDISAARRRSLEGRSGCGLCGVDNLAAAVRVADRFDAQPAASVPVSDGAVLEAFRNLPDLQELHRATRSVHAAAWCLPDGSIALVREDVGRHNALDKLAGALIRNKRLGEPGFVIMTSRLSFELIYKAVSIGAMRLATVSAPTSLALEHALRANLPISCLGPGGQLVHFPSS